jgi:hypothetical protein
MSLVKLRRIYAEFPSALRKRMEQHLLCMVGSTTMFLVLLFLSANMQLLLPPAAVFLFSAFSVWSLYLAYTKGDILFLSGICTALEQTPIRRKTKAIYATFEDRLVRVRLRQSLSGVSVGDIVTLLLPRQAPIVEQDGVTMVFRYYAITVRPDLKFDLDRKT